MIHPILFFSVYTGKNVRMEASDRINKWVEQYCQGTLSKEDREELTAWLEASSENKSEFERLLRVWLRVSAAGKWDRLDEMQENVWKRVIPELTRRRRKLYVWGARVAAVAVVLLGIMVLWNKEDERAMHTADVLKVESGSPKALLVLNTGKEIELKDGETRELVNIAGVGVVQDSSGGVRFEDSGVENEEEEGYNTIIVPERGEYFAVLNDGTKVWMNSGSELVFPTRFRGDRREVKLKGEAYFEVVSDKQKPFYVQTEEATVRVLGTAFNVLAYREDGRVEVALLRGKVSFDVKEEEYLLEPGEIATWEQKTGSTTVREGNVQAIVDWTSGRFNFEDISLVELAAKLERWYGVKFVFGDEASKALRFSGAVTKYRPLDYVLDIISKTTSVHFKSSGEQILIYSE